MVIKMIHYLLFDSRLSYFFQVLPFSVLIGIVYIIIRFHSLRKKLSLKPNIGRETSKVLFVCYIAGLLALVCTPPNFWTAIWFNLIHHHPKMELSPLFHGGFNFKPSLFRYIRGTLTGGSWAAFMQFGNALLFLPFGFLLPFCIKKVKAHRIIGIAFISSLAIELIQPIISRSFDVDDLINNTLGAAIGYFMYYITSKIILFLRKNTP